MIYFVSSLLFHPSTLQYIPRNMHTVFALLCFVVVIHWLIFPYPSGLLHWHCGNLTIAPVPAKQPWWIWINTSCEFIMNDCITTTKQSTTKPCAYFLGYTVDANALGESWMIHLHLCVRYTSLKDFLTCYHLMLSWQLNQHQDFLWEDSNKWRECENNSDIDLMAAKRPCKNVYTRNLKKNLFNKAVLPPAILNGIIHSP